MFKLYDYQQNLVDRARNSLAKGNKGVMIISPPGSGKSVVIAEIARLTIKKGGHVLFFVHRKELIKQISESFEAQGVDLSHATIMTVGKVANRIGKIPKPTLIICDESHHSRAKTYQKILDYYGDVPRLGFTATPYRLNGAGFDDIYDDMIVGPSVEWLIKNNKLADYDYYSANLFDNEKLKKSSTGDYTNNSISNSMRPTIYGDIIKHWKKLANNKQTIVYAHDIEHSKKIAEEFRNAGINAKHADSKTPKSERDHIMNDFKTGRIKILCNVGLVDEGFDIKECECCVIARPTESLVFHLQATMRCMRYLPEKKGVIIDHAGNYASLGLPDTLHHWSLKGREKRKGKQREPELDKYTTCDVCSAVFDKEENTTCPICGHEIETENESELKIDRNAELEKVDTQNFQMKTNYVITKKPEELTTVEELKTYAKAKGYKPGWIYFQQKQRGWL
ncbi:hypothetical protein TEHN7126_2243 [Tetragenococcus halophilus subsp. halophilus]|uniref:DEAD/DEAH box helicase family protein n=1 Tax=Tetragenococcus halophilus TaxID=51669 RepID=UPI000CC168EC|nr:DEAD/DEAH box helicase family protein [Tetragenococcus halophilus]GBD74215.1 hypothetical protein TEHN7125_2375 [Tetragenococcus halophilus subsp. halophilus]GBD76544.1 hypothetical protein TEHN7126_2243 [Tetragenococcus halophilus subsp. halophilus]